VRSVRRGVASALVLAALALAACGGEDSTANEEAAVRSTVKDLYGAFADKDADGVCGVLTRRQREAVAKGAGATTSGSCEQVMGVALNFVGGKGLEDADQAKVTKVSIDGEKATATVDFKGKPGELGLAKEGGEWRIDEFNPKKL
jgi:stage V sporulation protein SpoVS